MRALMVVPPVKVLSRVRMVVPGPIWLRRPMPEITPGKITRSLRLNAKVPLSAMLPKILPVVPPLPSCNCRR